MSEVYEVTVDDDERIREVVKDALDGLAPASDKQDGLHRRMNVDPDDTEELSGEALEAEMRKWLRGKRDSDTRLD